VEMNVFISWSGPRSRKLAEAVYDFLPDVIQQTRPWLSSEDIDRGRRWGIELAGALKEAKIGIICLTPENLDARWILFEAGALAKSLENAFVCPYLLGLEKSQVPPPLGDFQLSLSTEDETLSLVKSLNNALGRPVVDPERLRRTFKRCWPDLAGKIKEIEKNIPAPPVKSKPRDPADMLGEILTRLREFERARDMSDRVPTNWTALRAKLTGTGREIYRELAKGMPPSKIAQELNVDPAYLEGSLRWDAQDLGLRYPDQFLAFIQRAAF
jgi:hypothetical protein